MVVLGVYRYGASLFRTKISTGKYLKMNVVQVDPALLCTNGDEK